MTKTEQKAADLIQWIEGATLPECPFKIDSCSTVVDVNKYVETNILRLRNSVQMSYPFIAAYMSLFKLKKYIQNEQTKL